MNSQVTRLIYFLHRWYKTAKNLNTIFTLVLNIYSLFMVQNKGRGYENQHWKTDTYLIKLTQSRI